MSEKELRTHVSLLIVCIRINYRYFTNAGIAIIRRGKISKSASLFLTVDDFLFFLP